MTVTNAARSVTYTGNGVTTVFAFTFRVPLATHLVVQTYDTVTLALTTIAAADYTVTGIGDVGGGSVTYPTSGSPIASTVRIIISRTIPLTQLIDIQNQDGFFPSVIEDQLDLMVMQGQQASDDIGVAIKAPVGDNITDFTLPIDTSRASKYLFFASDGSLALTGTAPAVQYQGAFTTANEPTLRLGGGALQEGDLYYNTSVSRIKVRDNSSWVTGVDTSTDVDINGMTALSDDPALGDFIGIYDISASANRKITVQEMWDGGDRLVALGAAPAMADEIPILDSAVAKNMTVQEMWDSLTNLTAETAPAVADQLALYDATGSAADKITLTNFFKVINSFSADSSPDLAADYVVTYDNSASVSKKVLLRNLSSNIIAFKTADETVNNSTTLQDDDHLLFAMAANTTYLVDVNLLLSAANATPDFKFKWTFPTSCTIFWETSGGNSWDTVGVVLKDQTDEILKNAAIGTNGVLFRAFVRNSSNAGNLQLQWAQNSAHVSDCKVLKHSHLIIREIGAT